LQEEEKEECEDDDDKEVKEVQEEAKRRKEAKKLERELKRREREEEQRLKKVLFLSAAPVLSPPSSKVPTILKLEVERDREQKRKIKEVQRAVPRDEALTKMSVILDHEMTKKSDGMELMTVLRETHGLTVNLDSLQLPERLVFLSFP